MDSAIAWEYDGRAIGFPELLDVTNIQVERRLWEFRSAQGSCHRVVVQHLLRKELGNSRQWIVRVDKQGENVNAIGIGNSLQLLNEMFQQSGSPLSTAHGIEQLQVLNLSSHTRNARNSQDG